MTVIAGDRLAFENHAVCFHSGFCIRFAGEGGRERKPAGAIAGEPDHDDLIDGGGKNLVGVAGAAVPIGHASDG